MDVINNLVSIVIPMYNAQETVQSTLQSVIEQDYPNVEIIIVDDGSTDNSYAVCRQFIQEHASFPIRIIRTKNAGAGAAKNTGVQAAMGEYVQIVDADDHILPNLISACVFWIQKTKANVVLYRFKMVSAVNKEELSKIDVQHISTNVLSGHDALSKLFLDQLGPLGRNMMIKRSMFSTIEFPNRTHEDGATVFRLFGESECVVVLDAELYLYLQRDSSMVHTMRIGDFENLMANNQLMKDYVRERFPNLTKQCASFCATVAINAFIKLDQNRANLQVDNSYYKNASRIVRKELKSSCEQHNQIAVSLFKYVLIKTGLYRQLKKIKKSMVK